MRVGTPLFDHDGFDGPAQAIIARRILFIHSLIRRVAGSAFEEHLFTSPDDSPLRLAFLSYIPHVPDSEYLTLARQLGFPSTLRVQRIVGLLRRGLFDQPGRRKPGRIQPTVRRPAFADIMGVISTILEASEHITDWIKAFKQQSLCRDDDATVVVARALDRIETEATGLAKSLLLAWCADGKTGLLKHSDYPCYTELSLLQRYEASLIDITTDPRLMMAILRADVSAAYRAFNHPTIIEDYQKLQGRNAQPWDQSLLHQPANSEYRHKRIQRIVPLKEPLLSHIVAERGCDTDTAEHIFQSVAKDGLSGLIAWRCSDQDDVIRQRFDRERTQHPAAALLQRLPDLIQQKILTRLNHLQDTCSATGVYFPLPNLIRHLPSSNYRRKRQHHKIPEQLVVEFARRTGFSRNEALSCIKNFITYGPLGLIPKREWQQAFNMRLWSYLDMFKMGRVEGTIEDDQLVQVVNRYAISLGSGPLPRQLVLAVFNHFPKPGNYNSGDGEATATVPVRKALQIAGVVRLHQQWILIRIELDIQLVDISMLPVSEICSIVLVFDRGSQRVMSLWLDDKLCGEIEAGLALYRGIFHPDALNWPLRGLPEQICIPSILASGGIADLKRAATSMAAKIDIVHDQKKLLDDMPFAREVIKELKNLFTPVPLAGRRRAPKQQLTIRQAEERVLGWLNERCFPNHRVEPVPRRIRIHSVALPGYDTPAAGYLLPVIVEQVTTQRDGITLNRRFYTDPSCGIEPGMHVRVRAMPARLKPIRSVFIEYGPDQTLHYLPLQPSIWKER